MERRSQSPSKRLGLVEPDNGGSCCLACQSKRAYAVVELASLVKPIPGDERILCLCQLILVQYLQCRLTCLCCCTACRSWSNSVSVYARTVQGTGMRAKQCDVRLLYALTATSWLEADLCCYMYIFLTHAGNQGYCYSERRFRAVHHSQAVSGANASSFSCVRHDPPSQAFWDKALLAVTTPLQLRLRVWRSCA